ncbi:ion transporter [Alteribacillus bidgolensis]|uniref:Voltage-gated sodium channel n=1 Tax=Alteribacillus bidgolensis TaxID=930129 RepID=A0A1G8G798_9BACI|nr:ion transporter [Alteribacillus bidgolensis]SDH90284.1 voltage-gated sodium channel [Alteribacillus bidgolensis]
MNSEAVDRFRNNIARLVEHRAFINTVMIFILINAAIVGIETFPAIYENNSSLFYLADRMLLWIFTIEIVLRLIAAKPMLGFFKSSWNWFDFLIVFAGHVFAGAHFVTVLRILRVLRVLRAVSIIPSLRRLVDALLLTIPALGNIMILMSIIFYIYAVIGTMLYQEIAPEYFGNLQLSLLTLFQVVTLESWASAVMRPIFEQSPMAWIYFVSFVLVGTFVIFNLFIGVIVNNVEKASEMELPGNDTDLEKKEPTPFTNENQIDDLQREVQELKELLLEEKRERIK